MMTPTLRLWIWVTMCIVAAITVGWGLSQNDRLTNMPNGPEANLKENSTEPSQQAKVMLAAESMKERGSYTSYNTLLPEKFINDPEIQILLGMNGEEYRDQVRVLDRMLDRADTGDIEFLRAFIEAPMPSGMDEEVWRQMQKIVIRYFAEEYEDRQEAQYYLLALLADTESQYKKLEVINNLHNLHSKSDDPASIEQRLIQLSHDSSELSASSLISLGRIFLMKSVGEQDVLAKLVRRTLSNRSEPDVKYAVALQLGLQVAPSTARKFARILLKGSIESEPSKEELLYLSAIYVLMN